MKYYGITDKGLVRKNNQDSFTVIECRPKNCLIFALCDGMGGAKSGEIASEISKRAFSEYVFAKLTSRIVKHPDYGDVLNRACQEANGVAYEYSLFDEEFFGMGTTIVGGIAESSGRVSLVSVGDSRAYLVSPKKKKITQITKDHSIVQELVDSGVITRAAARTHSQKNIITRALGTEDTVEPDFFHLSLKPGESLLLCSDGLTNYVEEEDILKSFIISDDPEELCKSLLRKTYKNGAGDNVTVIVLVNR